MLDPRTIKQIREIVFRYLDPQKHKVFIFGSWAEGKARKFSDIDIGVEGEEPLPLLELEEAFEESDLPYLVEVVNFTHLSEKFKKVAKQKIIPLN
ncbi:MAG: nucleotidyltransferase domain-containing protein [Microgenomates group bacterium]